MKCNSVYVKNETKGATHVTTSSEKKKSENCFSAWYNLADTQTCHLREGRGRNQQESNKREGLVNNVTSTCGCLCFYLSHHLYLELYEFSTIHATKMSKDSFFFFLLNLAAPVMNDVADLASLPPSLSFSPTTLARRNVLSLTLSLSLSLLRARNYFTLRQVQRKRSTISCSKAKENQQTMRRVGWDRTEAIEGSQKSRKEKPTSEN